MWLIPALYIEVKYNVYFIHCKMVLLHPRAWPIRISAILVYTRNKFSWFFYERSRWFEFKIMKMSQYACCWKNTVFIHRHSLGFETLFLDAAERNDVRFCSDWMVYTLLYLRWLIWLYSWNTNYLSGLWKPCSPAVRYHIAHFSEKHRWRQKRKEGIAVKIFWSAVADNQNCLVLCSNNSMFI